MKTRNQIVVSLMAVSTVAMLAAGCEVKVTYGADPHMAPPAPPAVTVSCSPGQYLQGGKHLWVAGKGWQWQAPMCVARPTAWVDGCRWRAGLWSKQDGRWAYAEGQLVCPTPPPPPAEPTMEPPPPPAMAVTCAPTEYLRGGRYAWKLGKYVWTSPKCVARPATWNDGCRWVAGVWGRVGSRLVFTRGRLVCPEVPKVVAVPASDLPPAMVPTTYRPAKCAAGQVYYPGRYKWDGMAKAWNWTPGVCIARAPEYKACKWVPGRHVAAGGKVYYVRPAWNCRGKVTYIDHTGSTWTPPTHYTTYIAWKACPANFRHDAAGKCVRYVPACPAGTVRQGARCVVPLAPCPEGTVRRGARCVALKVVRPVKPIVPVVCPEGTFKRGNRCIKVAARPAPCPVGTVRRGGKCVVPAARPAGMRAAGMRPVGMKPAMNP